jgi:hypothetical protein
MKPYPKVITTKQTENEREKAIEEMTRRTRSKKTKAH